MSDVLQEAVREKTALDGLIHDMWKFLDDGNEDLKKLSEYQVHLIKDQVAAMQKTSDILKARIEEMGGAQ